MAFVTSLSCSSWGRTLSKSLVNSVWPTAIPGFLECHEFPYKSRLRLSISPNPALPTTAHRLPGQLLPSLGKCFCVSIHESQLFSLVKLTAGSDKTNLKAIIHHLHCWRCCSTASLPQWFPEGSSAISVMLSATIKVISKAHWPKNHTHKSHSACLGTQFIKEE